MSNAASETMTGAEWLALTIHATGTTHVFWVDAVLRNAQRAASAQNAALKRRCTPEDIAEFIVFLGFGAAMLTGQAIVIDGGLTL